MPTAGVLSAALTRNLVLGLCSGSAASVSTGIGYRLSSSRGCGASYSRDSGVLASSEVAGSKGPLLASRFTKDGRSNRREDALPVGVGLMD
ncbi:MAG: hypothetical protein TREMPRED_000775 [Tremellales sp. Tagirdzhanova-0007]|nr:MAG: hypothetical protein TREMPRED_000775 [Tremellales sp. Tagirdzhanova-0007]